MSSSSFAKSLFVLSVAVLGVTYGVAANRWGLFPSSLMRTAWNQAELQFGLKSPGNEWSRTYDREGVRRVRPEKMQPGLTFLSTSWDGKVREPKLTLIDAEGQVLHKWTVNRDDLFTDSEKDVGRSHIHGSLLLPNGDVVFNLEYVGTVRMDACGNVVWSLQQGGHHSVAIGGSGSFWIPGVSRKGDQPEFPGLGSVWGDQILHVSRDGKVLDVINVLDVLYQNDLERRIAKSRALDTGDVTHLNDVESLRPSMADEYPLFEAGDLLVSLRRLDLVFVFDPESLNVKWHASEPFIAQHDPDFTGDGWIGVFDNNMDGTKKGTMLGGSRIVSLQPHTDSTTVRFPTEQSDLFYTEIQGKWQDLGNGNILLAESAAGRVVEVGPDGRTVWEIVKPQATLADALRYDLTRSAVASWPCSSVDSTDASAQKQQ